MSDSTYTGHVLGQRGNGDQVDGNLELCDGKGCGYYCSSATYE